MLMILIENDMLVAENFDGRRWLGGVMALREADSWHYARRLSEFMAIHTCFFM